MYYFIPDKLEIERQDIVDLEFQEMETRIHATNAKIESDHEY